MTTIKRFEKMPQEFLDYMTKNYPLYTVIADAKWHAPKIWRAAMYAMKVRDLCQTKWVNLPDEVNADSAMNPVEHAYADGFNFCRAEVLRLNNAIEPQERDAARYQWLRKLKSGRPESQIALAQVILALREKPESMDAFIDEQILADEGRS